MIAQPFIEILLAGVIMVFILLTAEAYDKIKEAIIRWVEKGKQK